MPSEDDEDDFDDVEVMDSNDNPDPKDDAEDESDEDESDDDSDDEGDESDDEGEDEDKDEDEPTARKPRTAKERIKELARLRREAEQAAFDADMRAMALEKQLREGGRTASTAKELPPKPDPSKFTYGEVDPDYIKASIDYGIAEKEVELRAKLEGESSTRTDAEVQEHYRKRVGEVMAAGEKKFPGKFEKVVGSVNFDPALARLIVDSDRAVDIAYHLCNNLTELRALTRASDVERARKLGQLEGRLSAVPAGKRTRTQAPDTPGTRRRREVPADEAKYGPRDLDAFEKAFYRR